MLRVNIKLLRATFLSIYHWLWKLRGFWIRGMLCLVVGLCALAIEHQYNYDFRFKVRGSLATQNSIVTVNINKEEWAHLFRQKRNWLPPLSVSEKHEDNHFWHPRIWNLILTKILVHNPQVIGVSFHFSPNILEPQNFNDVFFHPKVVWATRINAEGKWLPSLFTNEHNTNTGISNLKPDSDGVLRRFYTDNKYPHFTEVIASKARYRSLLPPNKKPLINFTADKTTYHKFNLTDILTENFPPEVIKNKIVIIGSQDAIGQTYPTPLGSMSKSEVYGNIIDNFVFDKWVDSFSFYSNVIYLILILLLTLWVISTYPQSVALAFFLWLGLTFIAISIWFFDTFKLWVPMFAPIVQAMFTYVTFLGYQLTVREYQNLHLEQERKYLLEVEQLKNNFMSLVSHDLKTPIAKIQGICDRLLTQSVDQELTKGIASLRGESVELHRYIQSILRMTQVEARQFKLTKESTDINEVILQVIAQTQPLAKAKSIWLQTDLEPMFLIETDTILIQEVILNLIENAIKYTQNEGHIKVMSKEVDDHVYISVEDNGPGIDLQQADKIFEKFYRAPEQEHKTKGSGLGLYLSKYFIELHGGTIHVENKVEQGARFTISLPIEEQSLKNQKNDINLNSSQVHDKDSFNLGRKYE